MEQLVGILGIIIIFGGIIAIHEFGHMIVAKMSGMGVYEYSLGMGPLLYHRMFGDTQFSIRAIPFGGYVRIAGMDPEEVESGKEIPNGFHSKPFLARFSTILAGATMNFVLALIIFIIAGMTVGFEVPAKRAVVTQLSAKLPAEKAGIQKGDILVSIDGHRNPNSEKARDLLRKAESPIAIIVERDGKEIPFNITPITQDSAVIEKGEIKKTKIQIIGVGLEMQLQRFGPIESVRRGVIKVGKLFEFAIANIRYLFSGHARLGEVGGPVQIMQLSYETSKGALASREQLLGFFSTFAMISVLVGFFNLLPIPALDGSHLLFMTIEAIIRRPFDKKKEALVHLVGLLVLLGFILVITANDLVRWITGNGLFK